MKTLITALIIGLLVTLPARADTTNDVLNQLTVSGVNFSYSTVGQTVNILVTKKTEEKVNATISLLTKNDVAYTVTRYTKSFEDATTQAELERRRAERLQ